MTVRAWQVVGADGRAWSVEVGPPEEGKRRVVVDGRVYRVDARRLSGGGWSILEGGEHFEVGATRGERGWRAQLGSLVLEGEVLDPSRAALRGRSADLVDGVGSVTAPMAGKVVAVLVEVGDLVEAGQGLVVVEAMKMENVLPAPVEGAIVEVLVEVGAMVDSGQALLVVGSDA